MCGTWHTMCIRVKFTCTMYVYNVHACAYLCVFKRVPVDVFVHSGGTCSLNEPGYIVITLFSLHVCVGMRVCACNYVFVCMYIHVCSCTSVRVRVSACVRLCICACARLRICASVHLCVCASVRLRVCASVRLCQTDR